MPSHNSDIAFMRLIVSHAVIRARNCGFGGLFGYDRSNANRDLSVSNGLDGPDSIVVIPLSADEFMFIELRLLARKNLDGDIAGCADEKPVVCFARNNSGVCKYNCIGFIDRSEKNGACCVVV